MKKRVLTLILTLALALCLAPAAMAAEQDLPPYHTKSNGQPYYLMVNRAMNVVNVYALGEDGYYSVPCKSMICSVGKEGKGLTPLGTFTTSTRHREWSLMIGNTYARYATQITGRVLFHSTGYKTTDKTTLLVDTYNGLGAPASMGCVRLQVKDAKWLQDNCGDGCYVTVYDDPTSPGPLGQPYRVVDRIDPADPKAKWDPTDPDENNPWREYLSPFPDVKQSDWFWGDVRYVLDKGIMKGDGTFSPNTPLSRGMAVQILYNLSGAAASPAAGEAWYAPAVKWASERGLTQGVSLGNFQGEQAISRQEFAQLLYRHALLMKKVSVEDDPELAGFSDLDQVDLFTTKALGWCVMKGYIQGDDQNRLRPQATLTRAEAAAIFHRYVG